MTLNMVSCGSLFGTVIKTETLRLCLPTSCKILAFKSRKFVGPISVENFSIAFNLFHMVSKLAMASEEITIIIH